MSRTILRFFGGKHRISPWIISEFPLHRNYVETHGGAASVLMRKPRSISEVYNDLDDNIYLIIKVLNNSVMATDLQQQLERTPFSRREFELAHDYHPDPVEMVRRFMVRSFMGFGSDCVSKFESKSGFRGKSIRTSTTAAHDWVNFSKEIPAFKERLKGVVIENKDAVELIQQHDDPNTLFYCDPPYTHDSRNTKHGYRHEMTIDDHAALIDVLDHTVGSVVLSGYDNALYNQRLSHWRRSEKMTYADGARPRKEVLWIKGNK